MRRIRGDSNFITAIVGLFVLSMIVLFSLAVNQDMAVKQNLDSICREYIIKLETSGNINNTEVIAMQNEIKSRVIAEVGDKIDKNSLYVTVSPNTYGNNVSVSINCLVKLEQTKFIDGFHATEKVEYAEYQKTITSTSTN